MNGSLVNLLLAWLATYWVHSSLFLLSAWLLTSCRIVKSTGMQESVWRFALILGLFTATGVTVGPALVSPSATGGTPSISVPPSVTPVEPGLAEQLVVQKRSTFENPKQQRTPEIGPSSAAAPALRVTLGEDTARTLAMAWFIIALGLCGKLAILLMGLKHQLKGREPLSCGTLRRCADSLARQLAVTPPRLSMKPGLSSPFCVTGHEIVLPDWALSLPEQQQKALLAHELAHLKRKDPGWRLLRKLITAVAFFQPLNRLADRKLAELSEFACDAWSKKVCRSGVALAECLAECVRRQLQRPPSTLALAMAERHSPVLERTRRLLRDSDPSEAGAYSMTGRLVVLMAFLMLAGLAPVLAIDERGSGPSGTYQPGVTSHSGTVDIDDNGHVIVQMRVQSDSRHLTMNGAGRFTFNDAENGMTAISSGGFLDIRERADTQQRRVRFEEARGEVAVRFWRDGKPATVDEENRQWLGQMIPEFFRLTGLEARDRTVRLHGQGGNERVLNEIVLIPGSFTRRQYAQVLVGLGDLSDTETRRLMETLTRSMGSFDLRETLTSYAHQQTPSENEWRNFLQAAATIDSGFDLRRTLMAAVGGFTGPTSSWIELLDTASLISSSFDLRETLIAFQDHLPTDDEVLKHWSEVAGQITSSFDLSETVVIYAQAGDYGTHGWLALLEATDQISSSFDRRNALMSIAQGMPRSNELVSRYQEVAAGVRGSADREQARNAL